MLKGISKKDTNLINIMETQFQILLFYITLLFVLYSCKDQVKNCSIMDSKNRILSDSIIKDIPLNTKGNPVLSYLHKEYIANKLSLEKLENGFDSMQIRIWYGYAFKDTGQLVLFKNENNKWTSELLTLSFKVNENKDSVWSIGKTLSRRNPKSGWDNFIKKLLDYQILSLPDMSMIDENITIADGDAFTVEIATKKNYRFYQYQEPEMVEDRLWQAKNMNYILKLIEKEFEFKRLSNYSDTGQLKKIEEIKVEFEPFE